MRWMPRGGSPPRIVVPLIVPVRRRSALDRGRELIFVGGFRHAPNVDGLPGSPSTSGRPSDRCARAPG